MNKHRSKKRKLSLLETTLLVCAGLISVGAGISHAVFKTQLNAVHYEIERTKNEITDFKKHIEDVLQPEIDDLLSSLNVDAVLGGASTDFEVTPPDRIIVLDYSVPESTKIAKAHH